MSDERWAKRIATWLPRLAEAKDMAAAGAAIWEIWMNSSDGMEPSGGTDERMDRLYARAVALVGDDLGRLIRAWIERLLEILAAQRSYQQAVEEAFRADKEVPSIPTADMITAMVLIRVLAAVGERMDSFLGPLIQAIGTLGRNGDEQLCEVLKHAGPRVKEAVPGMLAVLRERGVWGYPSHLGQALARASKSDERVLAELRRMLSDEREDIRESAIYVLGLLANRAQPAVDQLLAFKNGSEGERCEMLHARALQHDPTPAILNVFEAAIRDENGYVRRSAAYALGEMCPEPDRFVPLLVEACNYTEHLHDGSLPEAAVAALAQYGLAARAALPRLRLFLEGPIKGRAVSASVVSRAIEKIAAAERGASISVLDHEHRPQPATGAAPVPEDEPLFAVTHQGRQCYNDRSGRIVIATEFSWGKPFSDGRAIVHGEDSTFVIDRAGRVVFRSAWDDIMPFSEGLAAVSKDEKWGFVDLEGRVVIEPQYDSVTRFSEGLAGIELGREKDTSGELITCDRPGRRGFIDHSGQVVIPVDWIDASTFHGGRAAVCTDAVMKPDPLLDGREALSDRRYGYIDTSGRLVVEGRYAMAAPFCEGLAAVIRGEPFGRSRAGYIDANGNEVIPLTFTSAHDFKDGLAIVHRRGRNRRFRPSVIDRMGQRVGVHGHCRQGGHRAPV